MLSFGQGWIYLRGIMRLKGRTRLIRIDDELYRDIQDFQMFKYKAEKQWVTQRDVLASSHFPLEIKEAKRKYKKMLRGEGGL